MSWMVALAALRGIITSTYSLPAHVQYHELAFELEAQRSWDYPPAIVEARLKAHCTKEANACELPHGSRIDRRKNRKRADHQM